MEQHLAPTLTEGQFTVLDYLLDRPLEFVKPSDLLPHLSTTPAAVTTLLDRMEKNGLIMRKRDDQDRRIVWIMPTDKGKSEGDRGRQVRRQFFEQTLDRLSRHNQQLFIYLFGKVAAASDND
ncbi:MarR family transcriptional regulator [Xylanibacillus composti]|nr:MarR family transcriptional regulator [Xylanibacillus composti]MDT9725536.1 MarR family transcriptional regulator [Xylanibacillus composti]